MKVLVIGGSGLIGSQVVANLTELGHEAVSASPRSGVDSVTGEGLAEAVAGVDAVVDVSNSPSFDDDPVMRFFTTSTKNLLAAEREAGAQHHVALSIVGADRAPDSGYMRAKVAQEKLIEESGQPYSIVRATQFFEFVEAIADSATEGDTVRLPVAAFQPIAAKDVAAAVTRATVGDPTNGITNIAGPEKRGMDEFIRAALAASNDQRQVVGDPTASYFGTGLDEHTIVPLDSEDPTIYPTRFSDWMAARAPSGAH
ncbi:LysR family transcriptional regulator [Mycobacterium sp. E1386]|uniref:SDR family oxidoreductase n=1 Tax=Mycobacterium sp. E1386 TaxID=1834126 RepID=UPI0007FEA44D|nr:SDR family oxidoreductase [Mycobacterium sp. E1386]OBI33000.1 LysR family transcriptional regulator [Mycobacterium sp. E1386]